MDHQAFNRLTRKPQRLTITISDKAFRRISDISSHEGRSMSNLSAYLLEQALDEREANQQGG
jgi:hypothetical protein